MKRRPQQRKRQRLKAQQQLHLMLESTKEYAIFSMNPEGIITTWNTGAERIFGYPEAEIIGQSAAILFTSEDRAREQDKKELTTAHIKGRAPDERWHVRKDGTRFFASGKVYPMLNSQQQLVGFTKIAWDTTHERLMKEALELTEAYLRMMLESAKDYAIFAINLEGNVTTWNEGSERIFGYQDKEIIGQSTAILFTPEDRLAHQHEQELITAREKGVAEDERWHVRKDGSRFYCGGMVRPMIDTGGQMRGYLKVCRDITKRLQMEETATELAVLQERQRLSRDLHDSISQMLFSSHMIAEALPNFLHQPEKLRLNMERLRRLNLGALAEMRSLLQELRLADINTLEMGVLLRQLAEIAMGHTTMEVNLNFDIKTPFPPHLQEPLYRIAQEALANIVKHARASQVRVTLAENPTGQFQLSIKDNGQGFDPSQLSPQNMGLKIMMERAKAIGAKFTATSVIGKGTEILVTFDM